MAYWMSKRTFGKVITPLKAVYARAPSSLPAGYAISKLLQKGFSIRPSLQLLVQTHTARLNGCTFCVDIAEAHAAGDPKLLEKCRAVAHYETDGRFSEAERAALRYTAEATEHTHVSDDVFEALRRHFTDAEIAELTILNAIENYYNLVNGPLGIESDGLCAIALGDARTASAAQAPT